MKYRIANAQPIEGGLKEFDVITEDGGIASIYHNGNNFVTCYYQTRLTDIDKEEYVWDELSDGKAYFKDWEGEPTQNELVEDALNWLARPEYWVVDDKIFSDINYLFPNQTNTL